MFLLDESAVDLDVLARADLLKFLSKECEERDATHRKEIRIKDETLRNMEFCPDFQSNSIANCKQLRAIQKTCLISTESYKSLVSRTFCGSLIAIL